MERRFTDPYPVRMSPTAAGRLAAACARLGVTQADAIREAIDEWITRHDTTEETRA